MAPGAGSGDRFNNGPPNQEHSHGEDLEGACSYLSEFSLLQTQETGADRLLFRVLAFGVNRCGAAVRPCGDSYWLDGLRIKARWSRASALPVPAPLRG
jgi:hypothetical protein